MALSQDNSKGFTNVKGFLELRTDYEINSRLATGLRYQHHFKPALVGSYHFYEIANKPHGELSLFHRQLSLFFSVRIHK
jgi:hypothetical protein